MRWAVAIHSTLACAMISDSLNEEHKGLKYIHTEFKLTETHSETSADKKIPYMACATWVLHREQDYYPW